MSVLYSIISNDEFEGATIIVGGETYTVNSDHPSYQEIVGKLLSGGLSEDEENNLIALINPIKDVTDNLVRVSERIMVRGTSVLFDGDPIENAFTDHISRILREDPEQRQESYQAYARFLENLATNPSRKSREHLTHFVEEHGITLDQDGYMILYKGVNADGTSIHAGYGIVDGVEYEHANLPNHVGAVVEIPRNMVDDDRSVGCSTGLHVGTYRYANDFKGYNGVLLTARVNPRDIVSVPSDSSNQKIRTARYTVLEVNNGEYTQATLNTEAAAQVDNDFEPDEGYVAPEDDQDSKTAFSAPENRSVEDVLSDAVGAPVGDEVNNDPSVVVAKDEDPVEAPSNKVDEFKRLIPLIIQGGWKKNLSVYKNKRITSGQRAAFQQAIDELGLQ